MAHPLNESKDGMLRLDFGRRLRLEFRDSKVSLDSVCCRIGNWMFKKKTSVEPS